MVAQKVCVLTVASKWYPREECSPAWLGEGSRRVEIVFLAPSTVTQDSEQVFIIVVVVIVIITMWLLMAWLFYEKTVVSIMQVIDHS